MQLEIEPFGYSSDALTTEPLDPYGRGAEASLLYNSHARGLTLTPAVFLSLSVGYTSSVLQIKYMQVSISRRSEDDISYFGE